MDMKSMLIEMLKDEGVATVLRSILNRPDEIRDDEVMNTEQLKEFAGVKETATICRWQNAGLPYVKGRPNLYFKKDVINFLKNKRIIFDGRAKGIGESYKTAVRVRKAAAGSQREG